MLPFFQPSEAALQFSQMLKAFFPEELLGRLQLRLELALQRQIFGNALLNRHLAQEACFLGLNFFPAFTQ